MIWRHKTIHLVSSLLRTKKMDTVVSVHLFFVLI